MLVTSICIPLFRPDPRHLAELLLSIAQQRILPDEVVLQWDGPEDPALGGIVPEPILDRTVVLASNQPLGMVENWNHAVRNSKGDVCILPGQDDYLMPGALEDLVHAMADMDVELVGSKELYINEFGQLRERPMYSISRDQIFEDSKRYLLPYPQFVDLAISYGPVLGDPCGMAFRRRAFDAVGGFDASIEHAADLDFQLRVGRAGGAVGYIARPCSKRRIHEANATARHVASGAASRDRQRLLTRFGPDASSEKCREHAAGRLVTHEILDEVRKSRYGAAVVALIEGLRDHPGGVMVDLLETLGVREIRGKRTAKCLESR